MSRISGTRIIITGIFLIIAYFISKINKIFIYFMGWLGIDIFIWYWILIGLGVLLILFGGRK